MHFSGRAFLILLGILAVLAVATQPAILTAVLPATPTPAGTPTLTPSPTATPTLDPLAAIPVATTRRNRIDSAKQTFSQMLLIVHKIESSS